jgi:hypothetical protein
MDMRIRPVALDEGERLREIAIAAKGSWGYDLDRVRDWAAMGDFSPAGLGGDALHQQWRTATPWMLR